MVGIQQTADIKLTVTLDKKGLTQLRAAMKTITTAMKTDKAAKDMRLLTNQIEKLKKELRDAKGEIRSYKSEQDKANKASKDSKVNNTAAAQAVRKYRQELQQGTKATQSSRQAEAALASIMRNKSKSVQQYVAAMKQRIGAERTLAVMRRQQLNAERAAQAAMRKGIGRTKEQIAAIQKLRAEQKAGAAQTKASIAAEQQINALMRTKSQTVRAYIGDMMRRIGAERTLAIVQKQMANASKNQVIATKRVRIEIKSAAGDIQRYHMGLVRASNAQNQFGKSLMQAKTFVGRFSKALSEAEGRMDALFRASFRLSIVGFTLQRFAQNIMRWGSSIMDVFEEFEFTLGRAAGALEVWKGEMWEGKDATQIMTDSVLGLAKEMKVFTAEEVAKGLYFWGSATGQTADSVEDLGVALSGLDKIMRAAYMTNTDYETTIKGVYSILTQFYSGDLSQAGDVTEKLFLSTQKTAAEWNDLIQSFKMVGPVAAQAGASFDQVNEAFGKLSDLGLRGSQAGRGLRQFFIQLVRPSGPAQKKWSELFEDNPFRDTGTMRETLFPEGEFVGITKAIQEIDLATQHLNDTDRITALARVTTANSLPLLTALMAQERNERLGLAEANDKLKDSDPAVYFRENWERLSTTWKAARGSFERVVESLKISLGANIASALEPLIESLNQIIEQVELFVKLNPGLVKMVAQFAALAAAGSMLVGTIFIISGALVGLFAAFHLVFDAIGKWAGQVTKAVGVLGLFGVAVADNINYLIEKGTEVVENLTAAFGNMDEAVADVIGVIDQILSPVRELMGAFVRLAVDIAVVVSEVIKFAAEIDNLASGIGWDIIVTALTVIVSTRIISGLLSLAAGMRLFGSATVGAAASGALPAIQAGLKIITSRSIIVGIQLLTMKMRALMASIPVVGWAALGISLLLTADQLPIIGDLVRSLSKDWQALNKELEETVSYFGEDLESGLKQLALEISPNSVKLPEAKKVLAPWVAEANEWAKTYAPDLTLLNTESTQSDREDFLTQLMGKSGAWSSDSALVSAFFALTENIRESQLLLDTALTDITVDARDYAAEWVESHKELSAALISGGRELKVSAEQYGQGIIAFTDNMNSDVWVGGPNGSIMQRGELVDNLVSAFLTSAPDKMTFDEFAPWLERFNTNFGQWLVEAISPSEALSILGDRVGKESTIVNKEVAAYIEKAMSEVDPYELRKLVHDKLPILGGMSIFEIMGNEKQYGDVQPLLQALMSQYDTAIASLEEGGASLGMDIIEGRLKNALETMQVNMLRNAMPNLADIAADIEQLALDNTEESYQALAQAFLDAFADGQSLAEMITSGKFEGTSISTLKSIAEALVKAGYGGDTLRKFVEDSAEDDGEGAAKSLREGFLNGLSQINEISIKDFKEAMKAGTTAEQIKKGANAVAKMWSMSAKSPQARDYRRESTQSVYDTARSTIRVGQRQGQRAKVQKGVKTTVDTAVTQYTQGNEGDQKIALRAITKAGKSAKTATTRAIRNSSLPQEIKDQVISDIWGLVESTPPSPPALESALSAITGTVEDSYDPLSSISAPKSDSGSGGGDNPFANVITTLLDSVPSAAGVVAAAQVAGKSVQELILDGLAYVSEDTGALNNIANFMAFVSAGIMTEEDASEYFKLSGDYLGLKSIEGFVAKFDNDTMMQPAMQGAVQSAIDITKPLMHGASFPVGEASGQGIADGIRSKIQEITDAYNEAVAAGKGESPPKVGPLKNIDKWGENVGSAWSLGVAKGMSAGEAHILETQAFTGAEITHRGKKEITIKLEVSSPDGTANRQKQGEIRRGALEALTAAGLEHYVTVG